MGGWYLSASQSKASADKSSHGSAARRARHVAPLTVPGRSRARRAVASLVPTNVAESARCRDRAHSKGEGGSREWRIARHPARTQH